LENYLAIKPQSFVEKSSLVVEELQFVQWDIFIWATLYSCNSLNLVKYQAKQTKTVVVLSTLHKGAACQTAGIKKPESVLYDNSRNPSSGYVALTCLIQCADRCRRRQVADDGHLPSSATSWT